MLRKPSSFSLRSPAPQVQEPRASDAADVVDTWAASLPIDLILEIFLRLEPAAVILCAGVCKPWRRAIISNASILGAHLDRFLGPSMLLGIFQYDTTASRLWRMAGPFQSALPSNRGGGTVTPTNSLIPAAASTALSTLLWLKDGFILLKARSVNSLCLCNPMTGYCSIFPAAAAKHMHNKYILLTASSDDDDYNPEVRILAVHRKRESSTGFGAYEETPLAYQLFSKSGHTAGVWGAIVQCSGDELKAGCLCVWMDRQTTAVGRDCVYWLAGLTREIVTCVLALDVLTGQTWTAELPVQCHHTAPELTSPILSMSSDGRLSLIQSLCGPSIQVWVLSSHDTRWTCQRTIPMDVHSLLSHCPPWSRCRRTGVMPRVIQLTAFCPRSRCVIIIWSDQELLVDIESASLHPHVRHIGYLNGHYSWPYEMDSSSNYISKMKQF